MNLNVHRNVSPRSSEQLGQRAGLYLATAGPLIFLSLLSLHRLVSTARVRDVLLGRGAVVQPL